MPSQRLGKRVGFSIYTIGRIITPLIVNKTVKSFTKTKKTYKSIKYKTSNISANYCNCQLKLMLLGFQLFLLL